MQFKGTIYCRMSSYDCFTTLKLHLTILQIGVIGLQIVIVERQGIVLSDTPPTNRCVYVLPTNRWAFNLCPVCSLGLDFNLGPNLQSGAIWTNTRQIDKKKKKHPVDGSQQLVCFQSLKIQNLFENTIISWQPQSFHRGYTEQRESKNVLACWN